MIIKKYHYPFMDANSLQTSQGFVRLVARGAILLNSYPAVVGFKIEQL